LERRKKLPKHDYEVYRIMALELDVAKAWRYIEATGRATDGVVNIQKQGAEDWGPRDPETWKRTDNVFSLFYHVNEERCKSDEVDTSIPLMLANLGIYGTPIIDGNHRYFKAYMTGLETMPAYVLTPAEAYCIVLNPKLFFHPDGTPKDYQRKEEIKRLQAGMKRIEQEAKQKGGANA
jgi:hypothetical protein